MLDMLAILIIKMDSTGSYCKMPKVLSRRVFKMIVFKMKDYAFSITKPSNQQLSKNVSAELNEGTSPHKSSWYT